RQHLAQLSNSVSLARRAETYLRYYAGGFALVVIVFGALALTVAVRLAGHLSRQLSRPIDELVGWTRLIRRRMALPGDGLATRGAPEFEALRQAPWRAPAAPGATPRTPRGARRGSRRCARRRGGSPRRWTPRAGPRRSRPCARRRGGLPERLAPRPGLPAGGGGVRGGAPGAAGARHGARRRARQGARGRAVAGIPRSGAPGGARD